MSEMFNPPHPGALFQDILPALGLSVKDAAEQLGVTRVTLSRVINGHAAVSAEMACRIEKWLGAENGGSARSWLAMQAAYDLWNARKAAKAEISKIKKVRRAKVMANDSSYALAA